MNDAAHVHQHRFEGSRRRLQLAFWTQLAFFVVELGGGILTNSLALLADAGHMLSDVGALGLSLLALKWTARPPTAQKTFGYHRLEILVALVNGLVLWAMAGYIFFEAAQRLFQPPAISGSPLIIIASLGLLVNLFGMYVLMPSREHNLNLRSAFLHLLADSFGSVAAIAAGRGHLVARLVLVRPPGRHHRRGDDRHQQLAAGVGGGGHSAGVHPPAYRRR